MYLVLLLFNIIEKKKYLTRELKDKFINLKFARNNIEIFISIILHLQYIYIGFCH